MTDEKQNLNQPSQIPPAQAYTHRDGVMVAYGGLGSTQTYVPAGAENGNALTRSALTPPTKPIKNGGGE